MKMTNQMKFNFELAVFISEYDIQTQTHFFPATENILQKRCSEARSPSSPSEPWNLLGSDVLKLILPMLLLYQYFLPHSHFNLRIKKMLHVRPIPSLAKQSTQWWDSNM